MIKSEAGSFRDRHNRVYYEKGRVFRGLSEEASNNWDALIALPFFQKLVDNDDIVKTWKVTDDPIIKSIQKQGWADVNEHQRIPFISYPYEWPVSMLRDAALLQLKLIRRSIKNDWTLKDATAYNIQYLGSKPTFIDTTSFEPRADGEPWHGYRQFCMMFLIPLLLKTHLNIDYAPLLRSNLEGIEASEAAKIFRGSGFLKKGVLSHVLLPAKVEAKITNTERDGAEAKKRESKQSKDRLLALLDSLIRTVKGLKIDVDHTSWSHYEKTHSYNDDEFEEKKTFVQSAAQTGHWPLAWDIGCNTGTFSKLIAPNCDYVIAADGDHNAVEQLYQREKTDDGRNILPLYVNLSNLSPNQGWGGNERKAFDDRGQPDFVICLALIHHISISANIPIASFLKWLRTLNAKIVIEFVKREDDMVKKLLLNRKEQYPDYNIQEFETRADKDFNILDSQDLKHGHRKIYFLEPK